MSYTPQFLADFRGVLTMATTMFDMVGEMADEGSEREQVHGISRLLRNMYKGRLAKYDYLRCAKLILLVAMVEVIGGNFGKRGNENSVEGNGCGGLNGSGMEPN